ncbi:MAG: GspH/FimT family pseudopilin [Ectothiorhodospiraceae bacterium]|nr:GspH/FimT family pseudopilin [Ectothiorhodospiraceae bacterium]MCH8503696.1 GspH/FimT family pseudopilin [Ectothiorhodospiraceae bacterium]
MKTQRGVTLIELMVALVVLAIIAGIAFPNFQNLMRDNRTTTRTNELVTAINLARSEAVRRGDTVTVEPMGGSFAAGTCVYVGGGCNGNNILRQFPDMGGIVMTGGASALVFDGRGFKSAPAGVENIQLAPPECAAGSPRARQLQISNTGRVSVERVDC